MSEKELDALLARMGKIAEAVNAFSSETVQQAAFAALVGAFGGASHAGPTNAGADPEANMGAAAHTDLGSTPAGEQSSQNATKKQGKRRAAAGTSKEFKVAKDLNLRPFDKQSFDDFIAEKQPKSNEDKFAVAIYYLHHILDMPSVNWHQIATVFRLTQSWREPADTMKALRVTSSRKATIDTTNMDDLKLTAHGRNFVEHDLTPKARVGKK